MALQPASGTINRQIRRDTTLVTRRFNELTALGCAELAARGAGQMLPAPDNNIAQIFEPRSVPGDALAWRCRFADAVAKTTGWQRDATTMPAMP